MSSPSRIWTGRGFLTTSRKKRARRTTRGSCQKPARTGHGRPPRGERVGAADQTPGCAPADDGVTAKLNRPFQRLVDWTATSAAIIAQIYVNKRWETVR